MAQEENERQLDELRQLKKDYISAFSSSAGKRVLEDLEKRGFMNRTTYSEGKGRIFFNEGMRFFMVHIRNMMSMDIKMLIKLQGLREQMEGD